MKSSFLRTETKKHKTSAAVGGQSPANQLLLRHKYLFVIGTVLCVDVVFLVPYLAIQVGKRMNFCMEQIMFRWSATCTFHLCFAISANRRRCDGFCR